MEAWRNELYHYGIKSMKWGTRRYRNYDGTLTNAGKIRYRYYGPASSAAEEDEEDYSSEQVETNRRNQEASWTDINDAPARKTSVKKLKKDTLNKGRDFVRAMFEVRN